MSRRVARSALLLLSLLAVSHATAEDGGACQARTRHALGGFFANPSIAHVTIDQVAAPAPGQACKLQVGDEILKINDRQVKGGNALGVLRYIRGIKPGEPKVYTVRRGGQTLVIDVRK